MVTTKSSLYNWPTGLSFRGSQRSKLPPSSCPALASAPREERAADTGWFAKAMPLLGGRGQSPLALEADPESICNKFLSYVNELALDRTAFAFPPIAGWQLRVAWFQWLRFSRVCEDPEGTRHGLDWNHARQVSARWALRAPKKGIDFFQMHFRIQYSMIKKF